MKDLQKLVDSFLKDAQEFCNKMREYDKELQERTKKIEKTCSEYNDCIDSTKEKI